MEVTRSNFNSTLTEIELGIKNCLFLSIDCELTGLKTAVNNVNAYDTPANYYQKVIKDCKEFLVIQYGLTLFRYDEETESIKHKSYNFYIFRRPTFYGAIPDQRFLCQTSSIDFLIGQNFDFNKLFKEGISYVNNTEEDNYRKALEEQKKKRQDLINAQHNGEDSIPIPEEHKDFIDDVIKSIEEFLASDETELQLPKCNAFLRRLIYQTKSEHFPNNVQLETRVVEKDRVLFATKLKSKEEREALEQKKSEELVQEMQDYIGFSKVVRMIVESEKLVVGHNLLLDFLHTVDKFLTPLPEDYDEFKQCASSLFTKIIDTKYMSSLEPFKEFVQSTVLGHLLDTLRAKPFKMPKYELEDGCQGYNVKDEKEHEAGYDSFITGLSLLAMWKFLGSMRSMSDKDIFSSKGLKLLNPYLNKIFLMKLTDNQCLNLAGEDLKPSRDHVFYLTFPKEWTTGNIVQLFSPFGNVQVSWVSDTSAYVGLYRRDQAAVALKTLSQSDTYSIMTFAKRQAQVKGQMSILPSPIKRKKSSEGQPHAKRKKSDSFDGSSFSQSKRSIEPIEEEQSETEEEENNKEDDKKSKTFAECDSWD